MKEEHLIKKLKSGNESALYRIIEQYTPYVSYIVENICGQAIRNEDKEEIISNVFLSLWRHHEQIDTEKYFSLKPYLGSIARNMSKNALRSLHHLYTETLDAHISLSSAQNTELEILKKEIQSILMDCIRELSDIDQVCILGYYYYDKSLSDISRETGLSMNNVKSKIFRSRKKIAAKLKGRGINYEDLQNYDA